MTEKERTDVEEKFKWPFEDIYTSKESWEQKLEEVKQRVEEMEKFRGELDSPESLCEALNLRVDISRRLENLSVYARMNRDVDTTDQEAQAMVSKVQAVRSEFSGKASYMRPEILELGEEKVSSLREKEERLEKYDHFFDSLFRLKTHTLAREEERIVSSLSEITSAPGQIYSTFMNADISFPTVEVEDEKVEITQANFTNLLKNPDRELRKEVHDKFYDRIWSFRNTVGTTQEKTVRKNVRMAQIREYSDAREASMKPDNIPTEVHDNLVEVINDNLDLLHRHAEMKRESLGVNNLRPEDLYMPLARSEDPEISYEQAKEYVLEALKPLGEEYVEKVRQGLEDERWVDVYETNNKRSGAYSGGGYDTKPYILMNYQSDISSLYTLIHELGHSMHSHYTTEQQPYVYSDYPIFVAEVASTTNEALLTHYLLENLEDENLRRHVISHSLESFRTTFFRQTMFSEFEHWMHTEIEDGKALTPDRMTKKYGELKESYYKPLEHDGKIMKEWMRIPHFYYNFYVYQYATGMSAALTLSEKILEDGSEDYLEFLKAGSSVYPIEALKIAGVDMSSRKPIEEAARIYEKRLDQAESEF